MSIGTFQPSTKECFSGRLGSYVGCLCKTHSEHSARLCNRLLVHKSACSPGPLSQSAPRCGGALLTSDVGQQAEGAGRACALTRCSPSAVMWASLGGPVRNRWEGKHQGSFKGSTAGPWRPPRSPPQGGQWLGNAYGGPVPTTSTAHKQLPDMSGH